ncbi:tryptophan ABC transporter substrate-binding protein [Streptococcus dentapri]|uniref:Tryptophan ABC transporter substrate-binding protein n=1 Tax=Streptococcus dentapri TaxID=573564 RepID=A0ABV8D0Z4_9STRE
MSNKRLWAVLSLLALFTVGLVIHDELNIDGSPKDKRVVKVGVLQYVTHEALDDIYHGIKDELAKEGYSGNKIEIQFLNAEGDQSKISTMSKQLADGDNDVLIGIATPAAQGLANATSDTPVVMGAISDPVGAKLVTNLKRPEGNVTGTSNQIPIDQTVDLIRTLTPNTKTVGILYASSEDNSVSQVEGFSKSAKAAGLDVKIYAVPSTNEITTTMNVLSKEVGALWIPQDNTIASAFTTVASIAQANKLPIYPSVDTMLKEGGLASVYQSQYQLGVETGKIAGQILQGKKVADVPVKVVDTGSPAVNLSVADKLGISIPDSILKEANKSGLVIKK